MAHLRSTLAKAAPLLAGLIASHAWAQVTIPSQEAPEDGLAILDSSRPPVSHDAEKQTVEACWEAWKAREGLKEGRNERNGDLVLLQKGEEAVAVDGKAPQWLAARDAAFQRSEIQARQSMSDAIATDIRSGRSVSNEGFGGDEAEISPSAASQPLSLSDKLDVLTGAALDAEIKKYRPKWDGTGRDDGQKRQELLRARGRFREDIASNSALFVSGAFTPVQCEGMNEDGRYAVLVGMIWSQKLNKIANAIWDSNTVAPPATPGPTLADQFKFFADSNPDWLAYSLGARVFTDEKGERVVVGFGVAPQTTLQSMDASRANLNALVAIQRFVGEKVQANQQQKSLVDQIETSSDEVKVQNNSNYRQVTELFSQQVKINGATPIVTWRGQHPWSGAKMQVAVVAWSAHGAADARATGDLMKSVEAKMRRQGAVPTSGATGGAGSVEAGSGAAAPVRSGAQSSTSDF